MCIVETDVCATTDDDGRWENTDVEAGVDLTFRLSRDGYTTTNFRTRTDAAFTHMSTGFSSEAATEAQFSLLMTMNDPEMGVITFRVDDGAPCTETACDGDDGCGEAEGEAVAGAAGAG